VKEISKSKLLNPIINRRIPCEDLIYALRRSSKPIHRMCEITAMHYLFAEFDVTMRKFPVMSSRRHVYASPPGLLDLLWDLAMAGTFTPWMLKIYFGWVGNMGGGDCMSECLI
jgi:hypothetical protein